MTSKKELFYIQRISELEAQLKQRDERIAALEKQVAELSKVNAELADKVAKLSKNSSNSSKPPSSDIVKPPSPDHLAKIANKEPNPRVRQRLLAVRLVVMGNTVPQAAKAVGLKQRQTRNWIHRFNSEGVNGLRDRPRPGQPVKLRRQKEQEFRERVEKGAIQKDRTCNLRVKDIQRILREEFGADLSEELV